MDSLSSAGRATSSTSWPSTEARERRIAPLDPATYRPHALHGEGRTWPETNCYSDLWIELLHGLGHDPVAVLPYTLAIDFEGDQWTFFKPPHADLDTLYGIDVQELQLWRPLVEHVAEQVEMGRPVLVELDAWYLPDTGGSAYRTARSKTTVAVNAIDTVGEKLGYFHNAGYYALEGEDFREVFQVAGAPHERVLPPYVEYVKWRAGFEAPRNEALVDASIRVLRRTLERAPRGNPFPRFQERFEADLGWLLEADLSRFHAYSFANLRQYGACFGLAEAYLQWLESHGIVEAKGLAEPFGEIAQASKAFQFQLARAMARRKPLDLSPLEAMGHQWQRGMEALRARFA
jgi:hypothetical protein